MAKDFDALTLRDFDNLVSTHGSGRRAAQALGVPRTTFQDRYLSLRKGVSRQNVAKRYVASGTKPKYFILTSAQDATKLHVPFWNNLTRYAEYLGAEIIVSGYTYNKSLFEDNSKNGTWFVEEIVPYMTNEQVLLGDRLVFCGEMNTLPTAVNPLSGFQNYTKNKSGVFPHPKVQLESVPTMKDEPAKLLYTTGSVTLPNYVPKKAGIKAEFHHILAALIVEVKPDGDFFARHLVADKDGSFYDLDIKVTSDGITRKNRSEALNFGDIHVAKLDRTIAHAAWGWECSSILNDADTDGGFVPDDSFVPLIKRLNPHKQFLHDVLDFEVRNHHSIGDPLFRYRMHKDGKTVQQEIEQVGSFLIGVASSCLDCNTYVVESNHDLAFERWLKTGDYRNDPANALFFLKCVRTIYENVDNPTFSILRHVIDEDIRLDDWDIEFLSQDESFRICEWDKGGIECAIHGHLGLNGARPNIKSFTKLGPRANVGHAHSAAILEGVYQAGITARLDHGYNAGPGSWSHSHIVTYANAKRAIITMDRSGMYTTIR